MKKKYRNLFWGLIIIPLLFTSCDNVSKPYLEEGNYCGNGNLSVPIRKILIEDYTGHRCGNCPRAAEEIAKLKTVYCDHLIPVAVHVGYWATPYTTGTKFLTDFRTEAGESYDEYFGNSQAGLPNGLINRTSINSSPVLPYSGWASAIQQILSVPPEIDIEISNVVDTVAKTFSTTIETKLIKSLDKDLFLCVWVTEDSITDWQKDYNLTPTDIENYTHRHVLRKSISPVWGLKISSGSIGSGKILTTQFSDAISEKWNLKKCSVVAFVYNGSNLEIYQAEEKHLISE